MVSAVDVLETGTSVQLVQKERRGVLLFYRVGFVATEAGRRSAVCAHATASIVIKAEAKQIRRTQKNRTHETWNNIIKMILTLSDFHEMTVQCD